MNEENPNREHKASVFTLLFGNEEKALELYGAVKGIQYPPETKIEIITLSNALFKKRQNDLAFIIEGKLVVLIEHQSTINDNMPLRMLLYVAREYEIITKSRDLYRSGKIKIPTPEFIVLYNGKEKFPDYKELKLSDSFSVKSKECFLELVVKAYNINKGCNAEFAARSKTLSDYEEFIALVKENEKSMDLETAIKLAVNTCMSRGILVYFLEKHASEIMNMIFTEWNWDEALEVAKEEGIAIGEEKRTKELFALLESGVSLAEAKQKFGIFGSQET